MPLVNAAVAVVIHVVAGLLIYMCTSVVVDAVAADVVKVWMVAVSHHVLFLQDLFQFLLSVQDVDVEGGSGDINARPSKPRRKINERNPHYYIKKCDFSFDNKSSLCLTAGIRFCAGEYAHAWTQILKESFLLYHYDQ